MEEMSQDEQQFPDAHGLGCEDPAVELVDGRRQHDLIIKRVMTDEEWTSARDVNGLLSSLVNTSYNRLMARIEHFFVGIEEVLKLLNTREARSPDPPLRERFSEAEYAVKGDCTIFMLKGDEQCGIGRDDNGRYYFLVEKYFEDFIAAARQLYAELLEAPVVPK